MSLLIGTETLAQMAFWVVVGFSLGGAAIAVFPRNILYNVLGLVLALAGVAGFYLYLGSFFIALMQLLIYVGAICISIVFAIMLSRPLHLEVPKRRVPKVAMACSASVIFFMAVVGVVSKSHWIPAAERSEDWSVVTIGHLLLTRYDLVFEIISLVLLVAIIGAILTAGYSRRLSS
ncbi:NADH-quinone oxidoreductase subunit J family protein [Desulforhabdus amnigena]|jgi:NADH-quinone oxidoreductase subunit J|uniref:NADH-quinone oxidoreductase subunit J n=1 Tax=Desulforhabdus amnigena TaxID=40218 RepID=A0A9W6CXL3_9BACT|nr:NADH-quinone oxidoreductase subunit J [Desulforhabdus amnigena]NLJ26911.1 NADH-quinone oxidoreductase subunit J [Deltaproteobacteria bacterium]GLI34499.1 NADH-quinone oxidoreductase subunit J [Desulforhabdus amnigena]